MVLDSGGSGRFVVVTSRGGRIGAGVSLLVGSVPVVLVVGSAVGPVGSGGGGVMVVVGCSKIVVHFVR